MGNEPRTSWCPKLLLCQSSHILESEELNQVSQELSYSCLVPSLNKIGAVRIHVIILVLDFPHRRRSLLFFFLQHSIFFLLVKALIWFLNLNFNPRIKICRKILHFLKLFWSPTIFLQKSVAEVLAPNFCCVKIFLECSLGGF